MNTASKMVIVAGICLLPSGLMAAYLFASLDARERTAEVVAYAALEPERTKAAVDTAVVRATAAANASIETRLQSAIEQRSRQAVAELAAAESAAAANIARLQSDFDRLQEELSSVTSRADACEAALARARLSATQTRTLKPETLALITEAVTQAGISVNKAMALGEKLGQRQQQMSCEEMLTVAVASFEDFKTTALLYHKAMAGVLEDLDIKPNVK